MTAQTQEAQSLEREDVLKLIVQHETEPFFTRPHLNREVIIALIGLRGDGKSGSSASITLIDAMMSQNKKVWSNMLIKCNIEVDDETARKHGMRRGGVVHYESLPLEKDALLYLDDRYRNSYIVIEEINVQYSNVRRHMTHTNVNFNIAVQQLRKFETCLIYNVIDEMFIDSQLRTLTDIFIKCEETALSAEGLAQKKSTGVDFKWVIYPMSGFLVGREQSYYVTKKPLKPVYFHFERMRGIYDDKQFQRKGVYSTKQQEFKANIETESSPEITEAFDKYGFLTEKAQFLKENTKEIRAMELWHYLELADRGISPNNNEFIARLASFGISKLRWDGSIKDNIYRVEDFDLETTASKPARAETLL